MSTELANAISKELQRRNFSLRRAAEEMEISHTTLSRLVSGKTRPDVETCVSIAGFLRLRLSRVLELAGYVEPDASTGANGDLLEEYLGGWKELREEDRRFVLKVIRTLLDVSEGSS